MKNCIGKELSKIPMPVRFSHQASVEGRCCDSPSHGCGSLCMNLLPFVPYSVLLQCELWIGCVPDHLESDALCQ